MGIKQDPLSIDCKTVREKITGFIRRYVIELNREGAVLGLSGGLDSCVILKLCVEALGAENVRAVIIPERDSDRRHIKDAKNFAASLSVIYTVRDISPILWWLGVYRLYPPACLFSKKVQSSFVKKKRKLMAQELEKDIFLANLENERHPGLNRSKAFYRIKHRLRSAVLFYYSELFNLLLVGTSNKSEILTGFFVKYGDNIADIMPLSSLYKSQVKVLAGYLGINSSIINKPPSPDLIPGVVDEEMLGLTYEKLDNILYCIEHNRDDNSIMGRTGATEGEIERVKTLIASSEYMRAWPINLA